MNRTKLVLLLALFFSLNLNAQSSDLRDDEDTSLPSKTRVVCGTTVRYVDAELGASNDWNTGNVFQLTPVASAPDQRSATSGVLKVEKDYEVAFTLTHIPQASDLIHGEDLLMITARLQRRAGAGKIKVLSEVTETSDQMSTFGEINGRRSELRVRTKFINPEVSTVLANLQKPMPLQEAAKAGLLADGIANTATFDCYMKVGVSSEF